MILEQLRNETKEAHQALEKLLIPRIKQINSPSGYIELLQFFYGYYSVLENRLDTYLTGAGIPEYDNRRKVGLLIEDIAHFDTSATNSLPECTDLPDIHNKMQALGAMYVLEGSTLGGKIISKMLQGSLHLSTVEGVQFFTGYGEDSQKMWASFTNYLDGCTYDENERHKLTYAANETFKKFKNWLETIYDKEKL